MDGANEISVKLQQSIFFSYQSLVLCLRRGVVVMCSGLRWLPAVRICSAPQLLTNVVMLYGTALFQEPFCHYL